MSSFNAVRSTPLLRRTHYNRSFKKGPVNLPYYGFRYNSTSNQQPTAETAVKEVDGVPVAKVNPEYEYKSDIKAWRRYGSVSIMKHQGRVYHSVATLESTDTAKVFPTIHGYSMNGVDNKVPLCSNAEAKVVFFSAKEYGFGIVRKWCDPFVKRFNPVLDESVSSTTTSSESESASSTTTSSESESASSATTSSESESASSATTSSESESASSATTSSPSTLIASPEIRARVSCQEIIFIEHSILWFFRRVYAASTIPKILPQQRPHTYLSFGSLKVSYIIPYHPIPYHTIPYHTIPYHTIPYHTIPYHTTPYHTIPYHHMKSNKVID